METTQVTLSIEQFNELVLLLTEQQALVENIAINLGTISQYIMITCIAFFTWFVIKLLYSLFAHVFFGGV